MIIEVSIEKLERARQKREEKKILKKESKRTLRQAYNRVNVRHEAVMDDLPRARCSASAG